MSLRSRLALKAPSLLLIDGSAFIFRSFYAFRNMSRSDGLPTNVIFMVSRLMLKLLREEKPDLLVFVMDGKGKNFRNDIFPDYKINRSATPEDLVRQLAPLKEVLGLLGVPVLVSSACEADDYIASLSYRFREQQQIVILGADKDLKQCLHENVILWDPAGKEEKITTLSDFRTNNGMEPSSWPDFQALAGDSSDNIPGIPQIGPKTALGLIQEFTTLETLFANLPAVQPKIRAKLQGHKEEALLYRELTRLKLNLCTDISERDLTPGQTSLNDMLDFMARYELHSLVRELESMSRAGLLKSSAAFAEKSPFTAPVRPASVQQTSLAGGLSAGNSSGPQVIASSYTAQGAPSTGPAPALANPGADEEQDFFSPPAKRAEYGNLLDVTARLAPLEFTAVHNPEQIPTLNGAKALALVPDAGLGLIVSAGTEEFIYKGQQSRLVEFLQSRPMLKLVAPDCKGLLKVLPELEGLPMSAFFDLSLAAYLLNPDERNYSFRHLTGRFAGMSESAQDPDAHPGLCALAAYTFLDRQIAAADLGAVLQDIELPLIPVLKHMEDRGVGIDLDAFSLFLNEVQGELAAATKAIHELAGRPFNIRSSQQLSDVLFSVLSLPTSGKTKGGMSSTSQEALEKLAGKHPIVEAILEFRKLEKLRSTYLEPLPGLADAQKRIHTTFNQTATATGRLSSSGPNLQNIPIRGPLGRRMRECFIAGRGKLLVCSDYSQIELRVLAHLSGEATLLDAFCKGEDIHLRTAGLLYDLPLDQIGPDLRRNAKTINFGLIYGMGAQKLARELHIGVKEADAFIKRYFARLGGLKKFYDSIEEEAAQKGFVTTMTGRRRIIQDIQSQNNQLRSQARRQAINTRIQGSAADIIKLAMLAVDKDPVLKDLGASLLLQIHDELLLEAPEQTAQAACERLSYLMSAVKPGGEKLSVELLVESGIGHSWGQAH
ncbi:MAG: DNA polymerase I [Desulfovibrio sp.]|jgi:DNA polymerase-1|nr:DNA polymerase I [Desulfovibrio sp.]